jgi:hypothetical protein
MFDAYCHVCQSHGLYPLSRITKLENSPLGIEVSLRCYCGEPIEVLLGRGPRDLHRAC